MRYRAYLQVIVDAQSPKEACALLQASFMLGPTPKTPGTMLGYGYLAHTQKPKHQWVPMNMKEEK